MLCLPLIALTASFTETWTMVMLRACGTGLWLAVTVAASAR